MPRGTPLTRFARFASSRALFVVLVGTPLLVVLEAAPLRDAEGCAGTYIGGNLYAHVSIPPFTSLERAVVLLWDSDFEAGPDRAVMEMKVLVKDPDGTVLPGHLEGKPETSVLSSDPTYGWAAIWRPDLPFQAGVVYSIEITSEFQSVPVSPSSQIVVQDIPLPVPALSFLAATPRQVGVPSGSWDTCEFQGICVTSKLSIPASEEWAPGLHLAVASTEPADVPLYEVLVQPLDSSLHPVDDVRVWQPFQHPDTPTFSFEPGREEYCVSVALRTMDGADVSEPQPLCVTPDRCGDVDSERAKQVQRCDTPPELPELLSAWCYYRGDQPACANVAAVNPEDPCPPDMHASAASAPGPSCTMPSVRTSTSGTWWLSSCLALGGIVARRTKRQRC